MPRLSTDPAPLSLPLAGGSAGAQVRVHPILTGEIHAPPAHTDRPAGRFAGARIASQLLGPRGSWDWLPVPAFLVEHPSAGPILIDTGLHPGCASDTAGNFGRAGKLLFQVRMEHDQALRFALPARGIEASSIGVVIMSHLHFDHASAVSEFPQATFVVDRREWAAAASGGLREGYLSRQFDHAFDWRTVDYDADSISSFSGFARSVDLFGDGSIRLASTPGHTLGHQSVILRTSKREILVLGDAAYTMRGLRGETTPMLAADQHLYRRSLREVRQYLEQSPSAMAIPSHDFEMWPKLSPFYG